MATGNYYTIEKLVQMDSPHTEGQLHELCENAKAGLVTSVDLRIMIEKAYRRGFVHGANCTRQAYEAEKPIVDIYHWIYNRLNSSWRNYTTLTHIVYPPRIA